MRFGGRGSAIVPAVETEPVPTHGRAQSLTLRLPPLTGLVLALQTVLSLTRFGAKPYTGTFVAQYYGAGRRERISPAVWHGVYLAGGAGVLLFGISFLAGPLMRLADHVPQVQKEEIVYFRVFMVGAVFMTLSSALASFYGGLAKTYYNMLLHIPGHCLNVFLNYCLIFGHFGFPRWGTKGAATATVICLAAEEIGDTDRLPTFLALYDRLAYAGLDIKLVGRASDETPE